VLLPLTSQGELLGLLLLGPHQKGEAYTPRERSLLASLIPQVAPAFQVAQMVREEQVQVRERERIEQELRTARTIQHSLLPTSPPDPTGWQIAAYYQPAREVGGDFYDFLPFEDGRLGIVIGDVSGKGIPAAMLMSSTRSLLRATAQIAASPVSSTCSSSHPQTRQDLASSTFCWKNSPASLAKAGSRKMISRLSFFRERRHLLLALSRPLLKKRKSLLRRRQGCSFESLHKARHFKRIQTRLSSSSLSLCLIRLAKSSS
jgi:hypothetical protein